MDMFMTGFAVLLFAAVILAIEGSWLWWSGSHGGGARRIARRLRLMSGGGAGGTEELSILKQRRYAAAPALDLRDLERALQQLPSAQREVLLLVALEEMRYEDVAAMLDIPPGTVMSRLSRARENLRRLMTGQAPSAALKVVK